MSAISTSTTCVEGLLQIIKHVFHGRKLSHCLWQVFGSHYEYKNLNKPPSSLIPHFSRVAFHVQSIPWSLSRNFSDLLRRLFGTKKKMKWKNPHLPNHRDFQYIFLSSSYWTTQESIDTVKKQKKLGVCAVCVLSMHSFSKSLPSHFPLAHLAKRKTKLRRRQRKS